MDGPAVEVRQRVGAVPVRPVLHGGDGRPRGASRARFGAGVGVGGETQEIGAAALLVVSAAADHARVQLTAVGGARDVTVGDVGRGGATLSREPSIHTSPRFRSNQGFLRRGKTRAFSLVENGLKKKNRAS